MERDWKEPVAPPPPPPPSPSKWSVQDLIKKGVLLLLLGFALFFLLRGGGTAKVSFDNGLDAPVKVLIDGKFAGSLSPEEVWNHRLRSGSHDVEIQGMDGKVVERREIFCREGYYIYNIAESHQYEIQYHIYMTRETIHESRAVPPPQPLGNAPFFQVDADIPLGMEPPAEIELPDGYNHFTISAVVTAKSM